MKRLVALILLSVLWGIGFAADLEHDAVAVPLPPKWKKQDGAGPLKAVGPGGALMQVSVAAVAPTEGDADASARLDAAENQAVASLLEGVADMDMLAPLSASTAPDGTKIQEVVCLSKDKREVLSGLVLRGPRAVVLITMESLAIHADELAKARRRLASLHWK